MNTQPKIEHREAHPYAAVRLQVPFPLGKSLSSAWEKVNKWLARQGISHGPAIIRYLTTDMSTELDIEVGFVLDQALAGGDGVLTDFLPAGEYATLTYVGSYRGKGGLCKGFSVRSRSSASLRKITVLIRTLKIQICSTGEPLFADLAQDS